MDDDVREALDEMQDAIAALGKARTPAAKRTAQADVAAEREDLEDVLRREGYRVSRKDLDALIETREEERLRKMLAKIKAEEEPEEDEPELDAEGKPVAKPKPKPKAKPGEKDELEEWT
jgi:hypothetical protein